MTRRMGLGAAAVLGLAGVVAAQQTGFQRFAATVPAVLQEPPAKGADPKQTDPKQPEPVIPDPTKPSGKLKELMTPKPPAPGVVPPVALVPPPKLPTFAIKARVVSSGGSSEALLDVDGKLFSVTPGSTLNAGDYSFRVVEIAANGVKLEVVQTKEVIVLN